ncbi:aminopeptidase P family protein [Streptomyces olivoverticillatus]
MPKKAPGAGSLAITGWADGDDPYTAAAKLLELQGRYGISDNTWALHLLALQRAAPGATYGALSEVLPMLRAVKDAYEVERLAAAGAAADAAYEAVVELRFAGRREVDVAADLARLLRENGHEQVDFTIVGSGPNGASPHHDSGERVIEDGDMVVMDFGGLREGYGSDTTRTVHVGQPTAEERKVHDVVREAQQAAFEAVRPGVACQEIDRAARQVIRRAGFGEYFIHRTGHGIGVTTHEPPRTWSRASTCPWCRACASRSSPASTCRDGSGCGSRTSWCARRAGGRRLNNTERELRVVE